MTGLLRHILLSAVLSCPLVQANAQEAFVEVSGTTSTGSFAPLWLSSNRQGIVSPYANSGYQRAGIGYDFYFGNFGTPEQDVPEEDIIDTREWHGTVVADVMFSENAQTKFFIHQFYGKLTYKKASIIIGQRERKVDLRNNRLTSGGLSQGINAQPLPEVLLDVDYFSVPFCNHWWKIRGRIGYGKVMDGKWQKNWVADNTKYRYTSNYLYHEKAIGFKFGDEKRFPLVFEPSLQMMTQFGGTTYNVAARGHTDASVPIVHPQNFKAFWHAFWPMGSNDETDGNINNAQGNILGSYNFALSWNAKGWMIRAYYERLFEDQSMLTTQYGLFDHLIGIDAELPKNRYVSHILVEHISTKDQAGGVYHDKSANMPESYTGIDNYYNHLLYPGWQNFGMTMGNPLITSPIYNSNHLIRFYNNRIRALHFGIDGDPTDWLSWRILATITKNWGTYEKPLDDVRNQQYFMVETTFRPKRLAGWQATLCLGYDHGDLDMIGNSFGAQLTIRKTFDLRR